MLCEEARADLKPLCDGEVGLWNQLMIKSHLHRCSGCAARYEQLGRLHRLIRSADICAPMAALEERATPRRVRKLALALCLVVIVLGGTFSATTRPRIVYAADVGRALGQVTTWHLTGWRLMNGKRQPWEIWGRRSPYMYYERNCDDIIFDDGHTQKRYFAPVPGIRAKAVIVTTVSSMEMNSNGVLSWKGLVDPAEWSSSLGVSAANRAIPLPGGRNFSTFRIPNRYGLSLPGVNVNELYTVDGKTLLPVRYQFHYDKPGAQWDSEYLEATYNTVVPSAIEQPIWPDNAATLNLVTSESGGKSVDDLPIIPPAKLKAIVTPLGIDEDGNILIGTTGILPVASARGGAGSAVSFNISCPVQTVVVTCVGQHGRILPVKYINDYGFEWQPGNFLLFSPLDPTVHGLRPEGITLPLTVSAQVSIAMTDQYYLGHNRTYLPVNGASTVQSLASGQQIVSLSLQSESLPRTLEPQFNKAMSKWSKTSDGTEWLQYQIYYARFETWFCASNSNDSLYKLIPVKFLCSNIIPGLPYSNVKTNNALRKEAAEFWKEHQVEIDNRLAKIRADRCVRAAYWEERCGLLFTVQGNGDYRRSMDLVTAGYWYEQGGRLDLAHRDWLWALQAARQIPGNNDEVKKINDLMSGKEKAPF